MEKTKKHCHIYEAVKQQVQNAEDTLINSRSLDLQNLKSILETANWLLNYCRHYIETTTNHLITYPLHRKLKPSKYIEGRMLARIWLSN
jgi:hypothetical protein